MSDILSLGGGSGVYRRTNKRLKRIYGSDKARIKMCLDKKGFDTEFEAQVAAAKLEMDYYPCLFCPHFHLTTPKGERNELGTFIR